MKDGKQIQEELEATGRCDVVAFETEVEANRVADFLRTMTNDDVVDGKIALVYVEERPHEDLMYGVVIKLEQPLGECGVGVVNEFCGTCGTVHFQFEKDTTAIQKVRFKKEIYVKAMEIFRTRANLRRDGYTMKRDEPLTSGEKGAMIGAMDKAFGGREQRLLALAWLFDYNNDPPIKPKSSKKLTESQWLALQKWISADPDDNWSPSEIFIELAGQIARVAVGVSLIDINDFKKVSPEDKASFEAMALGGKIKDDAETNEQ
jgi:hypothetical protein